MSYAEVPFTEVLSTIVDNRGRSCPTADTGLPLIATNCIKPDLLYPAFESIRYVSDDTYQTWFRGHPKPGDVLFVTKGSPGRVSLTPDPVPFCIAQDMVAVRADPNKIYPRYLFAVLRSEPVQMQIANMHVGTLIPHFKKGDFDKLKLPLPDPIEQRIIGDTYFDLSAKIDLNRRMNETLEAMARALFKSWFIDFDPVHAKVDGRTPEGMTDATAKLFPGTFEDSELGPIPKGWKALRLRQVADVASGGTPSKKMPTYWNGDIPWISPKSMNSIHAFDSDEHVTEFAIGNGTRLVPKGTVLIMVRGMGLHQGVRISQAQCDVTFNQDVKAVVATSVDSDFLLYALLESSTYLFSKVQASGHGTGVLPTDILDGLAFVVPPETICSQLTSPLTAFNSKIAANYQESRTLANIRDSLLPKFLSGELRIKDAERFVEANR